MKYLILPTLLFLSSCYTYKPIKTTQITKGEIYKIKTATNFIKIKADSVSETSIYFLKNRKPSSIDKNEILNLKRRKFSKVKTILLPVGIIGGLIIIADKASKNILRDIDLDIQPPP